MKQTTIKNGIVALLRLALMPLIPVYFILFSANELLRRPRRAAIPVLCVGNITTGGTGKTPIVMSLARTLMAAGLRPGVVSRGYRGSKSAAGALVSDGATLALGPAECGDEPFLIARSIEGVPVAIGADRRGAVALLARHCPVDLVIMDDGFQNRSLVKDLSIAVVDASNPFGNGLLLPAGDLREPARALSRADMIILNKCDLIDAGTIELLAARIKTFSGGRPVFTARTVAEYLYAANDPDRRLPMTDIKNKRILIATGIGNPDAFRRMVVALGASRTDLIAFPDHHAFSAADISRIERRSAGYDYILMSEKDHVKLTGRCLTARFLVLAISTRIDQPGFERTLIGSVRTILNS